MNQLIQNEQYNIGYICTRLQCEVGLSQKVAMRWILPSLEMVNYTFKDLDEKSNQYANLLESLGVAQGDKVFIFLPKTPDVFFTLLGGLKARAICCVLFSNFGEEALLDRVGDADAKVILTQKSFLRKIKRIWDRLPALQTALVTDLTEDESDQVKSCPKALQTASKEYNVPITSPDTASILHYTSGSTGRPKGVLHVHRSVLLQNQTMREVFQLQPNDIYWCTADQAWVTGVSYGVIGPWSMGITQIHFGGSFDPEVWFQILETQRVNVWYTAPTALRMLMQQEDSLYQKFNLEALRGVFSVGEPLNPEVIHWGRRVICKDIYDTWFQTETGSVMITNRPGIEIRPGSMGKPVNGIRALIVSDDGHVIEGTEQGNLCIQPGWSSMFITYLNNPQVYSEKFRYNVYFSGDIAFHDPDGYFWFVGRSDDVINTAGHLVSPFEVESALIELPEVVEAGVIAAPDEILFEKVVAYIRLREDCSWSRELELKVRTYVANHVSTIAMPQEIRVVKVIPKNKSGKIMRRVLKAWYTGGETGDTSTMEEF